MNFALASCEEMDLGPNATPWDKDCPRPSKETLRCAWVNESRCMDILLILRFNHGQTRESSKECLKFSSDNLASLLVNDHLF